MDNTLVTKNKAVDICSKAAIWIVAALLTVISVGAIIETSHIDPVDPFAELITFDPDFFLSNVALICLTLLGILAMMRKNISVGKLDTKFVVGVMLLFTTVLSLAWVNLVQSEPSGDAFTILNTAKDAAKGTYGSLISSGEYYGNHSFYQFYPQELGYVLFAEILYRIFGTNSSALLLQIPNIIALDAIYLGLVMLTSRMTGRKSVTNLTAIFLMGCLQPMYITTFTYPYLLALAFAVWAVYNAVRFMQDGKILNAVGGILTAAAAYSLRTEYMIILIAAAVALVLHTIDKKKFLSLALAALMILAPIGAQKLIVSSYASRGNATLDTHITHKQMLYAGVNESSMAPGWYNGLALGSLLGANMDMKAADDTASAAIDTRMNVLSSTGQTFNFFKNKLLSQVNEPTFQSIWLSQVKGHNLKSGEQLSKIAESTYTGGIKILLDNWFHYFDMMIYVFSAAGLIFLIFRKKLTVAQIILPLSFFGGILYHMLYEAKSQYMLAYFVLLIPIAAYGAIECGRALKKISEPLFR